MRIGILGNGDVGGRSDEGLAQLVASGQDGSREASNEKARLGGGDRAGCFDGSFAEARSSPSWPCCALCGAALRTRFAWQARKILAGQSADRRTNPLVFTPGASPALAWVIPIRARTGATLGAQARVVKRSIRWATRTCSNLSFRAGPPDMFILRQRWRRQNTATDILTAFQLEYHRYRRHRGRAHARVL